MMKTISDFFYMHGHGFYIWLSYGSVLAFLSAQWFMAWRPWRHYSKKSDHHE